MKNPVFIFLFLFIVLHANSQVILEGNVGYGFYDLKDIKSMQTDMLASTGFPNLKSVESFPNNLFYSVQVSYPFYPKNQIGFVLSYLTTGGRNHLADYSGEYKADMILNGYKIGAKYQYLFFNHKKFDLGIKGVGGVIASSLKIKEGLIISDEELVNEQLNMKGTGVFLEPSLKLSYTVLNNLYFNVNGGYEFDFINNLYLNNQKAKISSNWSGIRLSVGFAYKID